MSRKCFCTAEIVGILLLFLCTMVTREAIAGAIISNGPVSLGVNDEGHLIYDDVGLTLSGLGDALTPGCY